MCSTAAIHIITNTVLKYNVCHLASVHISNSNYTSDYKCMYVHMYVSKIWKWKDISVKTKVHAYKALVVPTLAYGSECWTLKKEDEQKLHSLEMNCLRRMIGVTRRDRIQNTVVREGTNATESITEEILRRRLSWFGHISRMEIDRLPARALYCHVTGERSQGRQAKKGIENIKEDFELRNIRFKDAIAWRQSL